MELYRAKQYLAIECHTIQLPFGTVFRLFAVMCITNSRYLLLPIVIIIILFESGNMANTQTHKNIQTDRQIEQVKKYNKTQ